MKGGVSLSNDRSLFLIMKLVIDSIVCNTDTATPLFTHERTTREDLNPRVYLIRKELPYHLKYNKDFWFTQVIVEKYIDENLVKTYSWLQSVTPEEKEEFLKINNPPRKKELTPAESKRKEYLKNYYEEHKEKYRTRYSSPEYQEKKKKYREEHKEEYNERAKQYYYRHREEKLKKMKEIQNNKINN